MSFYSFFLLKRWLLFLVQLLRRRWLLFPSTLNLNYRGEINGSADHLFKFSLALFDVNKRIVNRGIGLSSCLGGSSNGGELKVGLEFSDGIIPIYLVY